MLAEAEAALARGDQAAALASVRALFRPTSPLWAAEEWAHAFALAAKAARGVWGARVIAALTAAAAEPTDPTALVALGSALIDAGAADAATGVLWRAQLAAPEGHAALAELCYALELQGMHATAVQFLEGARPTGFLEHHLLAVNALLTRDRGRAERARAGRPAPANEAEAALGRHLDGMLGRARAIDGASSLGAGDERGWWYVWTGGVLGLTPDDEAPAAAWLRAAIEVWAGALTMMPRSGRWLMTLDTPEARVLGRAASALLGRPLDIPRVAGATGLWALPDASTLPPGAQVAFRWRAPNQFVFAAMADRTLPLAWCPELIGLSARVAWSVSPGAEGAAATEIVTASIPASALMQLAELGRFLASMRDFGPPAHAMREAWIRPGPDAWTPTGWAFARTASGARALPCRFPATHPEVQERRPRASVPALDEALGWVQAGRWAHALQLVQPLLERLRGAEDWRVAFQVLAAGMQAVGERGAAERLAAARAQPLDAQVTGAAGEAMARAGRGHEAAAILAWTTALAPTTPRWLEAMCAVLTVDRRLPIVRRLVADLGAGLWIEQYWRAWEALQNGDAIGARAAWSALGPGDARRKAWLGTAITRLEVLLGGDAEAPSIGAADLGDPRVRHWVETGVIAVHHREMSGRADLAAMVAAVAQALAHANVAAVAVPSTQRASQILALAVATLLERPAVPAESAYSAGAAIVVASVEELGAPSVGFGLRTAFWAMRSGPQSEPPDLRATLATGGPALTGALESFSAAARVPSPEVAAELVAEIRAAGLALEAADPVIARLIAQARARPDLGPRGPARDPYGYWPGAPWPEFEPR